MNMDLLAWFRVIDAGLLLPLAYVVRGRCPLGTTVGRVLWGLAVFEACMLLYWPALNSGLAGAGAFVGALLPHGQWYGLGRWTGNPRVSSDPEKCTLAMWALGWFRGSLIGVWLPIYWMLCVSAALHLASYLVTIDRHAPAGAPGFLPGRPRIMYAEALYGFSIFLILLVGQLTN